MSVVLALDPAQEGDAAALVAITPTGRRPLTSWATWSLVSAVALRHLPYRRLAQLTADNAQLLDSHGYGPVLVVVDATGIGRAVVEMVRAAHGGPVLGICFTAGIRVNGEWPDLRVPKRLMVDHLVSAFEHQAVLLPPEAPGGELLAAELGAFIDLGDGRTGAAPGSHDDTVTALATALWAGDTAHAEKEATA